MILISRITVVASASAGSVSTYASPARPKRQKHEMDIRIKGWGDGRVFHGVRSQDTGSRTVWCPPQRGSTEDLGSGGPA
jgi:hypothetical protein